MYKKINFIITICIYSTLCNYALGNCFNYQIMTTSATNITTNSAIFNANVTINEKSNCLMYYIFFYGPCWSPDSYQTNPHIYQNTKMVSDTISDLVSGTCYIFQAVVFTFPSPHCEFLCNGSYNHLITKK